MSVRMEILSLAPRQTPYFTVNTSADYVDIVDPVYSPVEYPLMQNAGGSKVFARGDSFTIISVGFVLPESFVMASSPPDPCVPKIPHLILGLKDLASATVAYIPEMSGLSGIGIPIENFESGISLFINVTSIYDKPFNLYARLALDPTYKPRVSMQGVPTTLNGKIQLVTVFIKILHNFDLT